MEHLQKHKPTSFFLWLASPALPRPPLAVTMAAAAVASLSLNFVIILVWCFGGEGAQPRAALQTNIPLGSSLVPTDNATATSWASPSGRFAFGFYPVAGGYRVGVWLATAPNGNNKTILWTALRDNPPITDGSLKLSKDGSLIWSSQSGDQERTIFRSGSDESAANASMLDSGNFAIYNSTGSIIWSTFDNPTDTIVGSQGMPQGGELVSSASPANQSTGRYHLSMQGDSNLVAYPMFSRDLPEDAYWNTGTYKVPFPLTLRLTVDGQLYLEGNGTAYWNITQDTTPSSGMETYYRAVLDADGVFRLYSVRFNGSGSSSTTKVEWKSNSDKCQVRGICGLNSYCSNLDGDVHCICPPGFVYIDSQQMSLGCSKVFAGEGCQSGADFRMEKIDVNWVDQAYSFTSSVTADQCMAACLEDCFCDAALFDNGGCGKQMLPLRYGMRGGSKLMFIKVSTTGRVQGPIDGGQYSKPQKKVPRDLLIFVCVAFAICLGVLCALPGFLYRRRSVTRCERVGSDYSGPLDVENAPLRAFSYQELERATGDFAVELGRGAVGTVFQGALGEKLIAVKQMDDKMLGDEEREFHQEVRAIGRTHHRNLVRLLGYCNQGSKRLLVYDYMRHGSLANVLFKAEERPQWKERLGIALDVARGLHYLHEECEVRILHCDIKPQNILMDEFGVAKIADFGLAKLLKPEQTRTMTQIRGTRGYVAPEWFRSLPVTVKADVYSFGVVLLEVAFCRKNVEPELPEEEAVLTDWAYDCWLSGQLRRQVDGEVVEAAELERVVKVGLWCIQEEAAYRPSMKNVVLMLEGNMKVAPPPPPASFS